MIDLKLACDQLATDAAASTVRLKHDGRIDMLNERIALAGTTVELRPTIDLGMCLLPTIFRCSRSYRVRSI